MHILFLLTQDLNSPSGNGRYLPMAVHLVKLGHQVQIAATHSNFRSLQAKKQFIDQVEITYVAQMHVHKSGNSKTYYKTPELVLNILVSTIRLIRLALSKRVDLILVGKPHPMNSVAGLIGRLRWGCPVVVDIDDDEVATGNFKNVWQKRVVTFFASWIPKQANWVTTNTRFMAQKLMLWGLAAEKIIYVPNGVDLRRFDSVDPLILENLKRALSLNSHEVIIYIGTLSLVSHPVDILLSAFKLLIRDIPTAILLLVGGGEDYETVQELAVKLGLQDAVHFCGKVRSDQVNLYYRLANVSVDPVYDNEVARSRCPLKLFESWACGIPFVTSDVGDRRYLAGDPPAAFLTTPGDAENLANALLSIIKNPEMAHSLTINANNRLPQFYWETLVKGLEKELVRRCQLAGRSGGDPVD